MAFKLLAVLTIVALAHGNQFEQSRQIQHQQYQINMEMQMEKERYQREMDDEQNNNEFMEMMFPNNMQQHLHDHDDRDSQHQMMDQYNVYSQDNKDDERQHQFLPQQSDNNNVLPGVFLSVPHSQLFTVPITVSQTHMVKQEQVPNFTSSQQDKDLYFPAKYEFGYFVNDLTTGDNKSQHEHREGDQVHGSYSLVEPDGSIRTVDYTADDVNGFQSEVRRTQNIHPVQLTTAQREVSYNPVVLSTSHPVLVENLMTPVSRVVVTRREGPGTFTHRTTTTNHQ